MNARPRRKPDPRRPFVCLPLLVLLCAWGQARGAEPDVKALHHGKELDQCTTCHGGQSLKTVDVSKGCATCHEDRTPGAVAQQVRLQPRAAEASNGTGADYYGMQGPMYYEESRLGAGPGPMVRIPAGKFLMGSDTRLSDEGPQHTVHLDDYFIDRYEVTNLQYKAFIDVTGRRSPGDFRNRSFPPGKADHPVTFVSWYDADAYCRWAGKRLPTEQEWEKAARGTDGRTFPWGNDFEITRANTPVRWAQLKQQGDTTPVGAFPGGASPYGVEDMSGNVWEWTSSWYLPHPGNTHPSENFGEIYKVLKGGSWWDCSYYQCGISAPTFNRSFFNQRVANSSFGFRCARDAD